MQTHTVDSLQSSATVWPPCGFGYNVKLLSPMEHILKVFLHFFFGGKYILCLSLNLVEFP